MRYSRTLLIIVLLLINFSVESHTFYASTASIKSNVQGGMTIKLRIFSDDLANAIGAPLPSEAMIQTYIAAHFKISINKQQMAWQWKSITQKGEHTECIWNISYGTEPIRRIYLSNTLLIASIEQQVNIVRLYLQDQKLVFNFNQQIQEEWIDYP